MSARTALAAIVALASLGCEATIESALSEEHADEIVVALDAHDIGARKEPSARRGEGFEVRVASDDVGAALAVLRGQGLPRHREAGVAELFDGDALVPTATEERARLARALGGELARAIESLAGVRSARVHVALPDATGLPLDARASRSPRAAVLVHHVAGSAPDEAAIRALGAGGVGALDAADVVVVSRVVGEAPSAPRGLAYVGPIAVSRGSASPLRALLAALLTINLALAGALVVVLQRRRAAGSATH